MSVLYSVWTFCTAFRDVCLLSSCFNKGPKILSTSGTADAVTACRDSVVRDTVRLECRMKRKERGQETSGGHSGADSPPLLTSSHLTVSRKPLYCGEQSNVTPFSKIYKHKYAHMRVGMT